MSHDSQLQQFVLNALAWEPSIVAGHIGVTADAGVVTLSGHVTTYAQKLAAETAARGVKGVKAVVEDIKVRLPSDEQPSDERIAAAAVTRLGWNVSVPRDAVKIKVENGWVTLTGEVDWHFERIAAEQDIRHLFGVTGVSNHIKIKPRAIASTISDDIMHALHRSWFFDPAAITVTVNDGRVRLTGTVTSPHDRQVAAATAWAASGVTEVENDLIVVQAA